MKILVIGGGPVGLYCSLRFKMKYPSSDITIVEKRSKYTRDQILLVKRPFFSKLPKNVRGELWGVQKKRCYIDAPPLTKNARCLYRSKDLNMSIRTADLEISMRNEANKMGIEFIEMEITEDSFKELYREYKPKFVFGCDGANSVVAKVLNTEKKVEPTFYGMGVTFRTDTPIQKTKSLLSSPQHRYRGFSSQTKDGYVGINISKKEFEDTKNVENLAKNALKFYGFDDTKDIKTWKFEINPGVVDKVCKGKIYLIGDSALTTHYFTASGVNMGFECVDYLYDNISKKDMCKNYKKFIISLHDLSSQAIENVDLKHKKTLAKCNKLDKKKVKEMSITKGITTHLPFKELCYLVKDML